MSVTKPKPSGASLVAASLTIEGTIDGHGDVRVAGRFKGTIHVTGILTIEAGAWIDGTVTADTVVVLGEVRGQIVAAARVELAGTGRLVGDLTTQSLVVAAGSKMQGHLEFGGDARTIQDSESGSRHA